MNTIGSCPQLTLTLESNWGGHRMHIKLCSAFHGGNVQLHAFKARNKNARLHFVLSPNLYASNQKHANMQRTNYGDKIQTSHESRHATYCNKRGTGQSLLSNCLMSGN